VVFASPEEHAARSKGNIAAPGGLRSEGFPCVLFLFFPNSAFRNSTLASEEKSSVAVSGASDMDEQYVIPLRSSVVLPSSRAALASRFLSTLPSATDHPMLALAHAA
jgi:hypothetical protein